MLCSGPFFAAICPPGRCMFAARGCRYLLLWACAAVCLSACDTSSGTEDVAEEIFAEAPKEAAGGKTAAGSAVPTGPPSSAPQPVAMAPPRTILKTVTQTLKQQAAQGWVDARSLLELTISISEGGPSGLAGPATAATRAYKVRCDRVRLSLQLPGQAEIGYDSQTRPTATPAAATLYQAMLGQGFEFRLSQDGRLAEVVGFEPFLERCLQSLPPAQQRNVRNSLPLSAPVDGVAWFLDESIGLLPGGAVQAGEQWIANRKLGGPDEASVSTRYTLRQLTSDTAEIDIAGSIVPAAEFEGSVETPGRSPVQIRGGQVQGHCRIDRATGLPIHSQVEQTLDMVARLDDGFEVPQMKTSVTTLMWLETDRGAAPGRLANGPATSGVAR